MKKFNWAEFLYSFLDLGLLSFLVFDFGFNISAVSSLNKNLFVVAVIALLIGFNWYKYQVLFRNNEARRNIALSNFHLLSVIAFVAAYVAVKSPLDGNLEYYLRRVRPVFETGLVVYFFIRLLVLVRVIYARFNNPAIIFVGSFFTIILIGAFLLMLPSATTAGISFHDALFTSTSAVCVTGLVVLDTAQDFTTLGQIIIMSLFQIGGLGILTFTAFFSYFFRGSSSFKEGLNVQNFIAQDSLKDVLKTALNIVLLTLTVEAVGFLWIYLSVVDTDMEDPLFFSLFHTVSAFCNAGFSTLNDGLANPLSAQNYGLQWGVMFMVVFGGLGYNIMFNTLQSIANFVKEIFYNRNIHKKVRVVTVNSRIVLITTSLLLLFGTALMFAFEYHNTLMAHDSWFGKFTTAAFSAVTPRTAGFNTFDMSAMTVPSLLIVIFLMWIGASPASTGGGIKTSTFALATLNILSVARGRTRIQILGRRISSESTNRAFAIVCISLIIIGIGIVGMLLAEPRGTELLTVVFECFSAYSTVGLSIGHTAALTLESKYILIVLMFVGRIGMLNLMFGLLRSLQHHQFYEYPKENILIN